jgi:hypothetical protein
MMHLVVAPAHSGTAATAEHAATEQDRSVRKQRAESGLRTVQDTVAARAYIGCALSACVGLTSNTDAKVLVPVSYSTQCTLV